MAAQALQPMGNSLSGRLSLDSRAWDEDIPVLNEPANRTWAKERSGNTSRDTSVSNEEERRVHITPIVKLRPTSLRPGKFQALQQWEAIVLDVTVDSVWVELNDLTNKQGPIEEAELSLAEIPENDLAILERGSVLYWSIGLEIAAGGQIQKVSRIRAKRSARWSSHQISKIRDKAEALFESMTNGQGNSPSAG